MARPRTGGDLAGCAVHDHHHDHGEVIRLDEWGQLFTIFVALTGIGSLFYGLTVLMDHLVMIRLVDPTGSRKMQRTIDRMENHVVIAGLGRTGKQAAQELSDSGVPFVIIDPCPESLAYSLQHQYLLVAGDATDDRVLTTAGLMRASGLIVTTGDEANNLYIVLSARVMRSDLFIVSRAVDEASVPKLLRAGANRAISPYAIGGRRLAHLILSPTVVDFFDTVIRRGQESLNLEGIKVGQGAAIVGRSLAELDLHASTGASVLVLMRDNRVLPNPDPALVLRGGDQLLAFGTSRQLELLERVVSALADPISGPRGNDSVGSLP